MQNEQLMHYGVKGMKWGVRKTRDQKDAERTRTTLNRHVSAGIQNMKAKGRAADDDKSEYDQAADDYKRASSKIFISRKNKEALVKDASERLSEAGKKLEKSMADLNRAERIYDRDAAAYIKHVDDMIKKFGNERVTDVSTKTIKIGEHWVKEVIRTGLTIANAPLVGRYYTGRYTSDQEYQDRMDKINRNADKRY